MSKQTRPLRASALQGGDININSSPWKKKKISLIFSSFEIMYVLGSKNTCPCFIYRYFSFDVLPTQFHYMLKLKKK